MELVVNSNRIIAALIRESSSRKIIYSTKFSFHTIEFGLSEVKKYKELIKAKSGLSEKRLNELMKKITAKISVFEDAGISKKSLSKAAKIIGKVDAKDIPFIALSIELGNMPVWSDDRHFMHQKEIEVWTTQELVKKLL